MERENHTSSTWKRQCSPQRCDGWWGLPWVDLWFQTNRWLPGHLLLGQFSRLALWCKYCVLGSVFPSPQIRPLGQWLIFSECNTTSSSLKLRNVTNNKLQRTTSEVERSGETLSKHWVSPELLENPSRRLRQWRGGVCHTPAFCCGSSAAAPPVPLQTGCSQHCTFCHLSLDVQAARRLSHSHLYRSRMVPHGSTKNNRPTCSVWRSAWRHNNPQFEERKECGGSNNGLLSKYANDISLLQLSLRENWCQRVDGFDQWSVRDFLPCCIINLVAWKKNGITELLSLLHRYFMKIASPKDQKLQAKSLNQRGNLNTR